MEIVLDRDSERPVYRQIAEELRLRIDRGALQAGEKLPPIRQLAERLGVNRDTVALAYDELATSGAVSATVGRGTFVREAKGAGVRSESPFEARLSGAAERLLEFERARPRYDSADGAIAMQELVPDPDLYPVDAFRRALGRALAREGKALLSYGDLRGHPALREEIARRQREAGIACEPDELVVTQGASQGIDTAIRIFAEAGSEVAVEEPTYANVIASVLAAGVRPAPVPMTKQGVDLEALRRTLARPEVRAFYTMPTFHNPMGVTSDLAHRRVLLEIAAETGTPVIEDAYEGDLRFTGKSLPSLAALDRRGVVVALGSFSKSLFPGARVGSIRARGRTLEALLALRSATDLGGSPVIQSALAEFLRGGHYERHLGRLRKTLRSRFDTAFAALEREMPEGVDWTRPEGGYQIWLRLPQVFDTRHLDARQLLQQAAKLGVFFVPGDQFYYPARPSPHLRLALARTNERDIETGIKALGRAIRRISSTTAASAVNARGVTL